MCNGTLLWLLTPFSKFQIQFSPASIARVMLYNRSLRITWKVHKNIKSGQFPIKDKEARAQRGEVTCLKFQACAFLNTVDPWTMSLGYQPPMQSKIRNDWSQPSVYRKSRSWMRNMRTGEPAQFKPALFKGRLCFFLIMAAQTNSPTLVPSLNKTNKTIKTPHTHK